MAYPGSFKKSKVSRINQAEKARLGIDFEVLKAKLVIYPLGAISTGNLASKTKYESSVLESFGRWFQVGKNFSHETN